MPSATHHPKAKKIVCNETSEIFASINKAARRFGLGDWTMVELLKGRHPKTLPPAFNYTFKYLQQPETVKTTEEST